LDVSACPRDGRIMASGGAYGKYSFNSTNSKGKNLWPELNHPGGARQNRRAKEEDMRKLRLTAPVLLTIKASTSPQDF